MRVFSQGVIEQVAVDEQKSPIRNCVFSAQRLLRQIRDWMKEFTRRYIWATHGLNLILAAKNQTKYSPRATGDVFRRLKSVQFYFEVVSVFKTTFF